MRTLYRPVLIESTEQATALPEGTFAVLWHVPWICELIDLEGGEFAWQSKNGAYSHTEMLGTTALVPIEADEEVLTQDTYASSEQLRRFTTPWQRFTSPKETP